MLDRWLDELRERNRDNVSRTASYLELYAYTVAHPPDLPWLLMAHLVSRNAGYWMSDLAARSERKPEQAEGLANLFRLLERANYLIFHDAWYHVLSHLLQREPEEGRASRFIREAWRRYVSDLRDPLGRSPRYRLRSHGSLRASLAGRERELVLNLVINEQNYIEHRVVHAPRFEIGLAMIGFIEASGREKPISFPLTTSDIRVGGFAELDKRILTGQRIFDEVLADRDHRRRLFEWASERPHTGDRSVMGEAPSPPIRTAWPLDRVLALDAALHDDPEPDPRWP